jgi:cytoskeletal protein RodZ
MSWVATAVVGGAIVSGVAGSKAAGKASKAATQASDASIEEQRRQFDLVRQDTQPYRDAAVPALDKLRQIFVNGDMSGFTKSPDYQFNLQEGQRAIDNSLIARGKGLSGAAVKEGVRYASGMASREFGSMYDRLAGIAGIGQTGVAQSAAAGMNAANRNSASLMDAGNMRGSSYMAAGQSVNNAIQGGASNLLLANYLGTPMFGKKG